jgi:diguanylate cyclase (GGDEF)-like protein
MSYAVVPARARILLVDDDATWRLSTGQALRQRGFDVVESADSLDLVGQVQRERPDLVIIDAMMPQIDGFTACRQLRAAPAYGLVPVLMMTGLDDELAISRAYDSGASDFFIKSTHWAWLAERVRHLIRIAAMQGELQMSQAKIARAQSVGGVAEYDYDLASEVVTGQPGSFRLFGFDEHLTAVPASVIYPLVDPACMPALRESIVRAIRTRGRWLVQFTIRLQDGRRRIVELDGEPRLRADSRVLGYCGVMRDVTEREQVQAELRRLAALDPLTGLTNRASFLGICEAALNAARADGRDLVLAVVDIDRFAHVNERFGQYAGDELLCQIARRLVEVCDRHRPCGDMPTVARLAGDEFAVLIGAGCPPGAVDNLLQRMLEAMREPRRVAGLDCVVSASIGVAQFPRDGDSAGLVLSHADLAIAALKSNGRNGIHWYSPAMEGASRVRLELAADLRRALESGELELHYQAILDVSRVRVACVEALIRWRKHGALVPPADFIPMAEETGLVIPMGEWAIGRACADLAAWRHHGVDIGAVAVNIPSAHFERASLLAVARDALHEARLGEGDLELELTETAIMRDLDRTLPRMSELRDLGVTIAIDDFGTGYSSLAYLTRLPAGKLKIDRSFVQQMGQSPQSDAIVRAIVALGRGLQMQVVAEGVETVDQARALTALGCPLLQGFLFSRPVSAADVPQAILRALATLSSLHAEASMYA